MQPFGGGGHERQRGVAIELAELVLDPLLAHDDPSPAAEVAAGRRLLGEIDAVEQQLVVDRSLEVEPSAHCACRGEHLVDLGDVEAHADARSSRAGTVLCHGVPAQGSRSSLAVSSLGATPVRCRAPDST